MQHLHWLNWTPKVGRNQRSLLTLNFDLEELQNQLAEEQISIGKYERALEILANNQNRFSQLLQITSGATLREGQLHIQLTYKRCFSSILPHMPLRNSERFFCRQLYSGLVSYDKDGALVPQLAHHWQKNDSATLWTFFLRPQLKFHNNQGINSDQIVALFLKLKKQPEYEKELGHVSRVYSKGSKLIFELSEPDLGFAGLLSDIRYSIQPEQQIGQHTKQVIGSGPFKLVEHSDIRLRISAFDFYHGYRALTDTVTIWLIDNENSDTSALDQTKHTELSIESSTSNNGSTMCHHYLSNKDTAQPSKTRNQSNTETNNSGFTRIEDGCLFLQFNQSSTKFTYHQRRYLSQLLSTPLLQEQLNTSKTEIAAVAAFNFLPSWTKIESISTQVSALPKKLNIAVYDHQALLSCSKAIHQRLSQMGIACAVNVYSYAELHKKAYDKTLDEELILSSFNLDDNRPTNAFRWFYANSVLRHGLGDKPSEWLDNKLVQLRRTCPLDDYLKELESIATNMIHQHWVSPLFHHRQTLRFEGILNDVSMTEWGWPDFRDVWSTD